MRMLRPLVKTAEIIQSTKPGRILILLAISGEIEYSSSPSDDIGDLFRSMTIIRSSSSKRETRFPAESEVKPSTTCDCKSSPLPSHVRIHRAARLSVTRIKKYLQGCICSSLLRSSRLASSPTFIKLISPPPSLFTGITIFIFNSKPTPNRVGLDQRRMR